MFQYVKVLIQISSNRLIGLFEAMYTKLSNHTDSHKYQVCNELILLQFSLYQQAFTVLGPNYFYLCGFK